MKRGHEVVMWQAWLKSDDLPSPKGLEQRNWVVDIPEKYFVMWDVKDMWFHENSTIYDLVSLAAFSSQVEPCFVSQKFCRHRYVLLFPIVLTLRSDLRSEYIIEIMYYIVKNRPH